MSWIFFEEFFQMYDLNKKRKTVMFTDYMDSNREDFVENYPQNVFQIPCFSSGLGRRQRRRREVEINNLHVYIYSKRNNLFEGHRDCEEF